MRCGRDRVTRCRGSGRKWRAVMGPGTGCVSSGPPGPSTPHKKMKKRKELNALIGLAGDRKKKRPGAGHHHPLLAGPSALRDSDSDTETTEEYSTDPGSGARCARAGMVRCCSLCSPVVAFVVLAACVMAVVGLVWMQQALKDNLDLLREELHAMESRQRSSIQEIPKMKEDLLLEQKRLDDLLGGELGLQNNITDLNRQIAQLSSAVTQLKANLKSAADLINLPKTMEELQKSVATLGSTLTTVHHDVETLQMAAEEQRKKVEVLQADMGLLDELNSTLLNNQQHSMAAGIANISQRVSALEAHLSLKPQLNSSTADPAQSSRAEEAATPEIQKQLQLINALTSNPDSERPAEGERSGGGDSVTSSATKKNFPRSLQRKRQRRSVALAQLSRRDLEEILADSRCGVTVEELQDRLGDPFSLEDLDKDKDGFISLSELLMLCSN